MSKYNLNIRGFFCHSLTLTLGFLGQLQTEEEHHEEAGGCGRRGHFGRCGGFLEPTRLFRMTLHFEVALVLNLTNKSILLLVT